MDPETWIEQQPEPFRADLRAIVARIRSAAPELKTAESGGMLAFGPFRYRYESGRGGDSALVTLAARKAGVSVYVNSVRGDGSYVAEAHAAVLGKKVKVGRSCITVKRWADVDAATFDAVVREAVALGGAGEVR